MNVITGNRNMSWMIDYNTDDYVDDNQEMEYWNTH